ncbi:unnamed protein product [Orchesella dallaii]|uniref:Uncharacterized protein n=1 Tax=Orchesella dallaii TaxID=48710 RepID=A0ABP1QPH4_9HEXA
MGLTKPQIRVLGTFNLHLQLKPGYFIIRIHNGSQAETRKQGTTSKTSRTRSSLEKHEVVIVATEKPGKMDQAKTPAGHLSIEDLVELLYVTDQTIPRYPANLNNKPLFATVDDARTLLLSLAVYVKQTLSFNEKNL